MGNKIKKGIKLDKDDNNKNDMNNNMNSNINNKMNNNKNNIDMNKKIILKISHFPNDNLITEWKNKFFVENINYINHDNNIK